MQNFTIVRRSAVVRVSLTAQQWQVFSDMPGVDEAVSTLNEAAARALGAEDREQARTIMMRTMDRLAHFGAADTEPRAVFAEMLDEVFGPERY